MRDSAANADDLEAGASNNQSSYPPIGQAIARQENRNPLNNDADLEPS